MSEAPTARKEDFLFSIKEGSRTSFNELYLQFAPKIHMYGLRLFGNAGKAQELVQEVFAYIWEKRRLYQPGTGRTEFYLLSVARNIYIKDRHHRFQFLEKITTSSKRGETASSDSMDQAEYSEKLIRSLNSLKPEMREMVCLVYFGDLSYKETAGLLNVSYATVKQRVSESLDKLRKAL